MSDISIPIPPADVYSGNIKIDLSNLSIANRRVVIAGEEESFKSAIAIGVRLALTGEYDLIGKQPSDLLKLAADPEQGIHVEIQGVGWSAEWNLRVDPSTGKAKKPDRPIFSGALAKLTDDERYCIIPTNSVRDLMKNARGDRKLREAILRRFGGVREMPEPIGALNEQEKTMWADAIVVCKKSLGVDASITDTLLASLTEYFRKEALAQNKIAKVARETFVAKKKELAKPVPGAEQLSKYQAQIPQAQAFEASEKERERIQQLKIEIATTEAKLETLEAASSSMKTKQHAVLRDAQEQHEKALDIEKAALTAMLESTRKLGNAEVSFAVYTKYIATNNLSCPYCSHKFASQEELQAYADEWQKRVSTRQLILTNCTTVHAEAMATVKDTGRALESCRGLGQVDEVMSGGEIEALRKTVGKLRGEYATAETALKQVIAYKGPSSVELQQKIAAITNVQKSKAALVVEEARVRSLEERYDVYKVLEKEAGELQKMVMEEVAMTASNEISLGMTDGRVASLDPTSMEFYVTDRNGVPRVYPGATSGTQRTSLLLGFAGAWTRGAPIRIGIFDDEDVVGLTSKGIRDFYVALEAAIDRGDFTQVIFVTNRPDLVPQNGLWHAIYTAQLTKTPGDAVLA